MAEEIIYEDEYGNPIDPNIPPQPPPMQGGMGGGMGYPYMDSGLFDQGAMNEIQNTRQFYLSYEELVDELEHFWKGEEKVDDVWINKHKDDELNPAIMSDKAARVLVNLLRGALSKIVRLTNFQGEDVKRLAYQSRERIASWLATEGWLKYRIPVSYLPMISHQCELLIYSSLLWGLNAGGQRFMNTSVRSVENVSQIYAQGQQRGAIQAGLQDRNKWFPKTKLF